MRGSGKVGGIGTASDISAACIIHSNCIGSLVSISSQNAGVEQHPTRGQFSHEDISAVAASRCTGRMSVGAHLQCFCSQRKISRVSVAGNISCAAEVHRDCIGEIVSAATYESGIEQGGSVST